MKKRVVLLFLLFFSARISVAQDDIVMTDSVEQEDRSGHFYFFPLIYWTPQTRLGGGLVGTYVFRFSETPVTTRPSTLASSFVYTQRKQVITAAVFDHFWMNNQRRFTAEVQYIKYPDVFWGTGGGTPDSSSEHYTPQTFLLALNYTRHIRNGLFIGALYEFDAFKITQFEDGGLLEKAGYGDRKTRITSGLGAAVNWDTRNSTLYPVSGSYHQLSMVPFHAVTGSEYDFVRFRFDLRKYMSFFKNHVLAVQFYSQVMFGHAPINKYAEIGSIFYMRGYYTGRYRDRQMVTFQAEYRFPVLWRFGAVAFAGGGDVSSTLPAWTTGNLKYTRGFGIRFMLNTDNHLNLRIDFAYGRSSAFPVIAIGESF